MIYYVDIDNTICKTEGNNYLFAKPIPENIAKINKLFDAGHEIHYYTSRGQTSGTSWTHITHKQLSVWGCKYHSLKLTKPSFDFIIDDKALRIEEL